MTTVRHINKDMTNFESSFQNLCIVQHRKLATFEDYAKEVRFCNLKKKKNRGHDIVEYDDPDYFIITLYGLPIVYDSNKISLRKFGEKVNEFMEMEPRMPGIRVAYVVLKMRGEVMVVFQKMDYATQDALLEKFRHFTYGGIRLAAMMHRNHAINRLLKICITNSGEDLSFMKECAVRMYCPLYGLSQQHQLFIKGSNTIMYVRKFVDHFYNVKTITKEMKLEWPVLKVFCLQANPYRKWCRDKAMDLKSNKIFLVDSIRYSKRKTLDRVVLLFGVNYLERKLDLGFNVFAAQNMKEELEPSILSAKLLPNVSKKISAIAEAIKRAVLPKTPALNTFWHSVTILRNTNGEILVKISINCDEIAANYCMVRKSSSKLRQDIQDSGPMKKFKEKLLEEMRNRFWTVKQITLEYLCVGELTKNIPERVRREGLETIYKYYKAPEELVEKICGVTLPMELMMYDKFAGMNAHDHFCQVIDELLDLRSNSVLLDLYCRSPFPSVIASRKCSHVIVATHNMRKRMKDCFHYAKQKNYEIFETWNERKLITFPMLEAFSKFKVEDLVVLMDNRVNSLNSFGDISGANVVLFLRFLERVSRIVLITSYQKFFTHGEECMLGKFFPNADVFVPTRVVPVDTKPVTDDFMIIVLLERVPFDQLFAPGTSYHDLKPRHHRDYLYYLYGKDFPYPAHYMKLELMGFRKKETKHRIYRMMYDMDYPSWKKSRRSRSVSTASSSELAQIEYLDSPAQIWEMWYRKYSRPDLEKSEYRDTTPVFHGNEQWSTPEGSGSSMVDTESDSELYRYQEEGEEEMREKTREMLKKVRKTLEETDEEGFERSGWEEEEEVEERRMEDIRRRTFGTERMEDEKFRRLYKYSPYQESEGDEEDVVVQKENSNVFLGEHVGEKKESIPPWLRKRFTPSPEVEQVDSFAWDQVEDEETGNTRQLDYTDVIKRKECVDLIPRLSSEFSGEAAYDTPTMGRGVHYLPEIREPDYTAVIKRDTHYSGIKRECDFTVGIKRECDFTVRNPLKTDYAHKNLKEIVHVSMSGMKTQPSGSVKRFYPDNTLGGLVKKKHLEHMEKTKVENKFQQPNMVSQQRPINTNLDRYKNLVSYGEIRKK